MGRNSIGNIIKDLKIKHLLEFHELKIFKIRHET
jgi:hypothetical protein